MNLKMKGKVGNVGPISWPGKADLGIASSVPGRCRWRTVSCLAKGAEVRRNGPGILNGKDRNFT